MREGRKGWRGQRNSARGCGREEGGGGSLGGTGQGRRRGGGGEITGGGRGVDCRGGGRRRLGLEKETKEEGVLAVEDKDKVEEER